MDRAENDVEYVLLSEEEIKAKVKEVGQAFQTEGEKSGGAARRHDYPRGRFCFYGRYADYGRSDIYQWQ